MRYRLPFFLTEITLLVLVGLSALAAFESALSRTNAEEWLIQLTPDPGVVTFLLLILMNLLLFALYFRPEAEILWWLNLVGLTSLTAGVLAGFSPGHVLVLLSIVFCLAYRRVQGLKHIWHWRGLAVVGLGIATGLVIATFGLGWPGMASVLDKMLGLS